jgi:CRP-like cAMP-binding protein
MEEVLRFLGDHRPLSTPCLADLARLTKFKKIRRGEIILRPGEIHRHLYFIKKGALHCYSDVGDKQVSNWFFWETHLAVSISSFYHRRPSKQYIAALKNTEVYYITRDEYEYLCETHGEFADIARRLLQDYLIIFHEYGELLRGHSAEEKYKWVLANMPDILDRISQKLVAPWMDMAPETLSRLRGRRR